MSKRNPYHIHQYRICIWVTNGFHKSVHLGQPIIKLGFGRGAWGQWRDVESYHV